MKPARIRTYIEAVYDVFYYFAECKSDYRQIVPAKTQYRYTYEHACRSGAERADYHGHGHTQRYQRYDSFQAHAGHNAGKRADAHKARVT